MVFSINANNYKYPIDNWLEFEEYKKKTKKELQEILKNIILSQYKIEFSETKSDLFSKETILELVLELKNKEYENFRIKFPIPYFTKVLQEKEKKITGKEISNTEIRKYEIETLMYEQ